MSIDPLERTVVDSFGAGASAVITALSVNEYGIVSEPTAVMGILTTMFAASTFQHARRLGKMISHQERGAQPYPALPSPDAQQ